jgi:hypothetical protein
MSNMSCMFLVRSGLGRMLDPDHRTRFGRFLEKILRSVKHLTHPRCIEGVRSSAKQAVGLVPSPLIGGNDEMMYRSISLARESSGDFTIVLTFSLLGLALSLLAIGRVGFIDPAYMADLLMLF